jgi:hypothetical protein
MPKYLLKFFICFCGQRKKLFFQAWQNCQLVFKEGGPEKEVFKIAGKFQDLHEGNINNNQTLSTIPNVTQIYSNSAIWLKLVYNRSHTSHLPLPLGTVNGSLQYDQIRFLNKRIYISYILQSLSNKHN